MPSRVDISNVATLWEKDWSIRKRIRDHGRLILSSDGAKQAPKIMQKEVAFNSATLVPLLKAMSVSEKDKFGNFSLFSIPNVEKETLS